MERFIVTGSSGYLGRKVTSALKREGHTVVGADLQNADLLVDLSTGFEFPIDEDFENTHLIHLAAKLPGAQGKSELLSHSHRVSQNLLNYANQFNRTLIMSSTAVYRRNMNKDVLDVGPWEAYGKAKLQMEEDFISKSQNLTILRPGTILGPHRAGGIVQLLRRASKGKFVVLPRQGHVTHPFVHVEDVVKNIIEWSKTSSTERLSFKTLIASGPISIAESLLKITGNEVVSPKVPDLFFRSLGSDNFPVKGISKWHLGALLYDCADSDQKHNHGNISMIDTIKSVLETP
jgi:nucleoside-diphosphate-sugar epimerase